jgi:hypothetical protein
MGCMATLIPLIRVVWHIRFALLNLLFYSVLFYVRLFKIIYFTLTVCNVPDILLCLMLDDFTRQGESASTLLGLTGLYYLLMHACPC